jgi:HEAT repeat protein
VSAAGAKLLSAIGEPSDAPALLRLMVGPEEPALSARLALMRIPGPETTALLLEAFHGKDAEARVAALEVLVGRGHRALLSELLKPELFADEAFRPLAANAVLTLGTGDDLGRVLEFHRTLPLAQRGPLEAALRRIAAKHPSADAAATTVLAAAAQLPLGEAAPLYTILAGIGGDAALAAFSGMLNSSSADQRNAALRALGSWRDTAPTALLLDIASHDADPGVRTLAVRSATTLFTKSAFGGNNAPVPALVPRAIEGLRKTWAAAQPAEKSAVISALRSLKDPRAVAAAEELEKSVTRDP